MNINDRLNYHIWDQIRSQVSKQIWWYQIHKGVRCPLQKENEDEVFNQVLNQVEIQFRNKVRDQVEYPE